MELVYGFATLWACGISHVVGISQCVVRGGLRPSPSHIVVREGLRPPFLLSCFHNALLTPIVGVSQLRLSHLATVVGLSQIGVEEGCVRPRGGFIPCIRIAQVEAPYCCQDFTIRVFIYPLLSVFHNVRLNAQCRWPPVVGVSQYAYPA